MQIYLSLDIYTHECTFYKRMTYMCAHVHICIYVYVFMCVYMCMCMPVCVCLCIYYTWTSPFGLSSKTDLKEPMLYTCHLGTSVIVVLGSKINQIVVIGKTL